LPPRRPLPGLPARPSMEDWRDETARALGKISDVIIDQTRAERDAALIERDRKIGILEGEIRELKGFVGGLLTLLGKSRNFPDLDSKSADVHELPRRFLRRTHHG
jgi:hypothetical protein